MEQGEVRGGRCTWKHLIKGQVPGGVTRVSSRPEAS